jgi:histidinol phosphatase-like enzyme
MIAQGGSGLQGLTSGNPDRPRKREKGILNQKLEKRFGQSVLPFTDQDGIGTRARRHRRCRE